MSKVVEQVVDLLAEGSNLDIARNLLKTALQEMPRKFQSSSWLLKFKKSVGSTVVSGPPESMHALLRHNYFEDDIEWKWANKSSEKAKSSQDAKSISIIVTGLIGEPG